MPQCPNAHLVRCCTEHQITFTRRRPDGKNDQAHVEQKNGSVVRRWLGYGRYETREALTALQAVDEPLRRWTHCWQPSLKLGAKERDDATGKARQTYDEAKTPYRRRRASGLLTLTQHQTVAATCAARGPVALRRRLATAVERFTGLQERRNELLELANVS